MLNGPEWIRFPSDEEKVAGRQTWWMVEARPSSLGQLHADTGTELDASFIAGPERGLRYCCRIQCTSDGINRKCGQVSSADSNTLLGIPMLA